MSSRKYLKELYLSWFNDFLTINRFAEYHDISPEDAAALIDMGRKYHNEDAEVK